MLKFISIKKFYITNLLLFSFSLINFADANMSSYYEENALALHEEVDGKSEATKPKKPKK